MLLDLTNRYTQTHMPWVAHDRNKVNLYAFCVRLQNIWKIHYAGEDGVVHRLQTGLADDVYECAPVASFDSLTHEWYISFVAGNSVEHPRLSLYYMKLTDTTAHVVIEDILTGFFMDDKHTGYVRYGNIISYGALIRPNVLKLLKAVKIFCLRPYKGSGLIASYTSAKDFEHLHTLVFNPSTKQAVLLTDTSENIPLYKACYDGHDWYYAQRVGDDLEDRRIVRADDLNVTPVDFDEYVEIGDHIEDLDLRVTNRRPLEAILFDLPKELR